MKNWIERKRHSDEPDYVSKPFNAAGAEAEFQRDRARVIHSAAFRRLQSKTQVLGIGESDFYRTRLTHSLEVAQIGTSIRRTLSERITEDASWKEHLPYDGLIETIGLLHDLGHPPFGHGGEIALNYMMKDHGGFEGNGQTLRIIAKLGEYSPSHGLDLTRRSMLGALKYPCLYSDVVAPYPEGISSSGAKPPKCIFDDESDTRDWILSPFADSDKLKFIECQEKEKDGVRLHSRPLYKSIDTSILELADDTAYGVHDLEDALALQLIDEKVWKNTIAPEIFGIATNGIQGGSIDFYNQKLFSKSGKDRKHAISRLVGYFVTSTIVTVDEGFSHPLLRYNAAFPDEQASVLKILKDFVRDQVIMRPQVQTLEYKGQQIVLKLFEVLLENPKRLLPTNTYETYSQCDGEQERMRCISDFISGMTDTYATKLFLSLIHI